MFILSILSLVFLLPGSNFIEWSKEFKRMFYRALLIPLFYMTIITTMANVFPETFINIFFSVSKNITNGFYLDPYEIPVKEGMEPLD
jgi:Ca2+/Na+ antiporter